MSFYLRDFMGSRPEAISRKPFFVIFPVSILNDFVVYLNLLCFILHQAAINPKLSRHDRRRKLPHLSLSFSHSRSLALSLSLSLSLSLFIAVPLHPHPHNLLPLL